MKPYLKWILACSLSALATGALSLIIFSLPLEMLLVIFKGLGMALFAVLVAMCLYQFMFSNDKKSNAKNNLHRW